MFRKTFTGSLVAASLTASALMFTPAATAAPTWTSTNSPSQIGTLPSDAHVVMAENGTGVASWLREVNGQQRVQASYFSGGASATWSAPANVSPTNAVVASPNVAINDQGDAVAAWLQKDVNDHFQVRINRFTSGAFGASEQISYGNVYSAVGEIDAAMDGTGRFWAAYQVSNNGPINLIRVVTEGGAGPNEGQWSMLSNDSAFAPDLAVNNAGDAVLAYYNAGNGSSTIDVRRYSPDGGWTTAKTTGPAGQYKVEAETTLADNGTATVGYSVKDLDDDYRATAARVNTVGTVVGATYVSPAGVNADHVSLDQNDTGAAVFAWNQANTEVGYKTRAYPTAGWASGSAVNAALSGPTYPKVALSDNGSYLLGWTEGGDLNGAYRGSPVLPFVKYSSAAIVFDVDETSVGIDNQGNAFLGGVYQLADPTQGALHVRVVDGAGPTSTLAALPSNTLTQKIHLAWSAQDRFSDVTAYDVRVKTTRWTSTDGTYTSVLTGTAATSFDFATVPGRTYCFEIRARDAHANYGTFTAPKCTTTPVDDRGGVTAQGFKRAKASSSYLGTYSVAKKRNAKITFQHVKANRIAILVSKVAKGGKIKVSLGGKTIGTYSLKGSGHQRIIAAKNLGSLKSGTLVIKVVSSTGKVVRIDGVILSK